MFPFNSHVRDLTSNLVARVIKGDPEKRGVIVVEFANGDQRAIALYAHNVPNYEKQEYEDLRAQWQLQKQTRLLHLPTRSLSCT